MSKRLGTLVSLSSWLGMPSILLCSWDYQDPLAPTTHQAMPCGKALTKIATGLEEV